MPLANLAELRKPPSDWNLTSDILMQVAKLTPRKRRETMALIGEWEWQKCADDIFYWLDPTRHFATPQWPHGQPYVFTNDPHPMYVCDLCNDDTAYVFNKRHVHLELRHDIHATNEKDVKGYFRELSTTRPFYLIEYAPPIIETWLRHPLIVIEKSRDMMATWLTVIMYTWDTLFHQGRQNIFQSEDSSKTDELVQRAKFIYTRQPDFLKNVFQFNYGKGTSKAGLFKCEALSSEIIGFPQGADQIRQYHPTGLFSDEAAFQSAAGDTFSAVKPAIQNGGRYTAVSSANPSFFMHLARDTTHTLNGSFNN